MNKVHSKLAKGRMWAEDVQLSPRFVLLQIQHKQRELAVLWLGSGKGQGGAALVSI